jgi:hypothetical protein
MSAPRPAAEQDFPARHHAALPETRMAQIPWLLVDGMLISPFPTRKDGPTASETIAIKAMAATPGAFPGCSLDRWGRETESDDRTFTAYDARFRHNVSTPYRLR